MSSQSQLGSGLKSLTTGWESMSLPCYRASWAARPLPMPAPVLGALALVTVTYLVAVYAVKRWFIVRYQLD